MPDVIINPRDMMTQNEFIQFTNISFRKFKELFSSINVQQALGLRRRIQAACTTYSRFNENHSHMDKQSMAECAPCHRKWKAVGDMCMHLERVARVTYIYWKRKEIARGHPAWNAKQRKIEAKRQWEKFVQANSY